MQKSIRKKITGMINKIVTNFIRAISTDNLSHRINHSKLETMFSALQNNIEDSLPYVKAGHLPRSAELEASFLETICDCTD